MYLRQKVWQDSQRFAYKEDHDWVNMFQLSYPCVDIRLSLEGYGWKPNANDKKLQMLQFGEYKCYYRRRGTYDWIMFARVVSERADDTEDVVYRGVTVSTGELPEELYDVKVEAIKGEEFESWGGAIENIKKNHPFYFLVQTRCDSPLEFQVSEVISEYDWAYGGLSEFGLFAFDGSGIEDICSYIALGHMLRIEESMISVQEYVRIFWSTYKTVFDVVHTTEFVDFWTNLLHMATPVENVSVVEALPGWAITPFYAFFVEYVSVIEDVNIGLTPMKISVVQNVAPATIDGYDFIDVSVRPLNVSVVDAVSISEYANRRVIWVEIEFTKDSIKATENVAIDRIQTFFSDDCSSLVDWMTHVNLGGAITVENSDYIKLNIVPTTKQKDRAYIYRSVGQLPEETILEFKMLTHGYGQLNVLLEGAEFVETQGQHLGSIYCRHTWLAFNFDGTIWVGDLPYQNPTPVYWSRDVWVRVRIKYLTPNVANKITGAGIRQVWINDVEVPYVSGSLFTGSNESWVFATNVDNQPLYRPDVLRNGTIAFAAEGYYYGSTQSGYACINDVKFHKTGRIIGNYVWNTVRDTPLADFWTAKVTEYVAMTKFVKFWIPSVVQTVTVQENFFARPDKLLLTAFDKVMIFEHANMNDKLLGITQIQNVSAVDMVIDCDRVRTLLTASCTTLGGWGWATEHDGAVSCDGQSIRLYASADPSGNTNLMGKACIYRYVGEVMPDELICEFDTKDLVDGNGLTFTLIGKNVGSGLNACWRIDLGHYTYVFDYLDTGGSYVELFPRIVEGVWHHWKIKVLLPRQAPDTANSYLYSVERDGQLMSPRSGPYPYLGEVQTSDLGYMYNQQSFMSWNTPYIPSLIADGYIMFSVSEDQAGYYGEWFVKNVVIKTVSGTTSPILKMRADRALFTEFVSLVRV